MWGQQTRLSMCIKIALSKLSVEHRPHLSERIRLWFWLSWQPTVVWGTRVLFQWRQAWSQKSLLVHKPLQVMTLQCQEGLLLEPYSQRDQYTLPTRCKQITYSIHPLCRAQSSRESTPVHLTHLNGHQRQIASKMLKAQYAGSGNWATTGMRPEKQSALLLSPLPLPAQFNSIQPFTYILVMHTVSAKAGIGALAACGSDVAMSSSSYY